MKSAILWNVKSRTVEGISSPKEKEWLKNSPQKGFQGSPNKGKISLKPDQKPIKCYQCDGWGHGWRVSNSGKHKLEGTSGSCSFNSWKSWLHSHMNLKSKSVIYKILRQSDLYHNPDPLFRLVGEVNETTVIVEGQEARALIDSGSQLSAIPLAWVKKLKPKTTTTMVNIAN